MGSETVAVFAVDGHDTWRVAEFVQSLDGGYSEVVVYVPAVRIQTVLSVFDPDELIDITVDDVKVFTGRALTPSISWESESEEVRAVFRGAEWEMERYRLWGQKACKGAGLSTQVEVDGLPCVFNADGKPNKYVSDLGGDHVFQGDLTDPDSDPVMWTIEEMVEYVIQELEWRLGETIVSSITWPAAGKDKSVPNVVVQGQTAREALCEVLQRAGMSWWMKPDTTAGSLAGTLKIVKRSDPEAGETLKVTIPAVDGSLPGGGAGSDKATPKGTVTLDFAPCVKKLVGYGAPKIFEDTFTLVPGWTQAEEDAAFGGPAGAINAAISAFLRNCVEPEASASWEDFKNVGRRYILNETGHEPNKDGSTTAYDFSSLFGSSAYCTHPRPFLPHRMTKDDEGNYLPIKVFVSDPTTGGYDTEREYEIELLTDVAGIYFRGARFPIFPENAAFGDDLQKMFPVDVGVIAAVVSDNALKKDVSAASPDLDTEVEHILDLDSKAQWDNINGSAVKAAFDAYVTSKADQWAKRVDGGRFLVERYSTAFEVGKWVVGITGRTLTLRAQILGVRWNADMQTTEIITGYLDMDTEFTLPNVVMPAELSSRAREAAYEQKMRLLRKRYPTESTPPPGVQGAMPSTPQSRPDVVNEDDAAADELEGDTYEEEP